MEFYTCVFMNLIYYEIIACLFNAGLKGVKNFQYIVFYFNWFILIQFWTLFRQFLIYYQRVFCVWKKSYWNYIIFGNSHNSVFYWQQFLFLLCILLPPDIFFYSFHIYLSFSSLSLGQLICLFLHFQVLSFLVFTIMFLFFFFVWT